MTSTQASGRQQPQRAHYFATSIATAQPRVGPADTLPAEDILARIPALPIWADVPTGAKRRRLQGASRILQWLSSHPGDGWQDRWLAAGADRDTRWLDQIVAADPRAATTKRDLMCHGLAYLLLCRVVFPNYDFLASYRAQSLFGWTRQVFRPDLFDRMEKAGAGRMHTTQTVDGLKTITKMMLHTGRDVDQLTAEDIYEFREWFYRSSRSAAPGVHAAWELLQAIGVLPPDISLRASLTRGQQPTEYFVDLYQIQSSPGLSETCWCVT